MATRQSQDQTQTIEFGDIKLPPALQALLDQAAGQLGDFMGKFPLTSIMQDLAQRIVPLTPTELTLLGQQLATSQAPAITYPELAALTDINQLIGGPIGSSPATQAGMNAYNMFTAPQIMQSLALSGNTQGGALAQAMTEGQTAALVPLLQQEISNRMGVLAPLAGIGATVSDRERNDIATGLGAAGMPRQIAQAQETANWQDVMRRANVIQGIAPSIFGQIAPATIPPPNEFISSQGFSKTTSPGIWTSLAKK